VIDYGINADWPPKRLVPVYDKMAEWSVWWAGDREHLASYYGGGFYGDLSNALYRPRPAQLAGGVVGWWARWWWGQPVKPNQQSPNLHMPLAADIAVGSADLLFGEELAIETPGLSTAQRERLDKILDANSLHARLLEAAEAGAALGGTYLRIVQDAEVDNGDPIITVVPADCAIPTFRWGRFQSVQFWHVLPTDGNAVWRHVEEYRLGVVEHALFEGSDTQLGVRRELTALPETRGVAAMVDASSSIPMPGMNAFYVPNMLPNRLWNVAPDLGRSDFNQAEPLFDALDEAWTSLMRDVRLGKARLIVPESSLIPTTPGKPMLADIDQEVFTGLNIPPNAGKAFEEFQPEIRAEQHLSVIGELVRNTIERCGYSAATFGLNSEGGAQTAAEVRSRERRSLSTREKKTRYWTERLEALIDQVAVLAGIGDAQTKVTFPAAVAPSPLELANVAQALKNAEAASTRERVRVVHPDWDDEQLDEEVEAIESATKVEDPTTVADRAVQRLQAGAVQPEQQVTPEPEQQPPATART